MSASVDVLAALDDYLHLAMNERNDNGETERIAIEARAAVAELIEVNKRMAAIAHKKAGGGFWMVPNTEMTDLRAALARVQP
jgi:hypothetical protein